MYIGKMIRFVNFLIQQGKRTIWWIMIMGVLSGASIAYVNSFIYAKIVDGLLLEEYDKATKHFMSAIDLYKISSRNSLDRYEGTAECYMECGVMFAKTNQHENAVNCLEFALKHYEILKRNNCGNYDLQIEYIDKWLKGAKND